MCPVTCCFSPLIAPFLTTTLASLSIRIELHHAAHLAGVYPSYGLKMQTPPFTRPSALTSHLNTHGDHFLVSRHPMHDNTQRTCVLFSTNGSNGDRSATIRPPFKLRWHETTRKWNSNHHSAICACGFLFSTERIRNSMLNEQSC